MIAPGDRIAQLVFTRVTRPDFSLVDAFDETQGAEAQGRRGAGGFGSTGTQ